MKSVVITGSTRGIGLAMALEFLRAGCRVTLSGRGEAPPPGVAALLKVFEERAFYFPCDVKDRAAQQRLWDASRGRWGAVDIWVCNAGQNAPRLPVWETGEAHTRRVVDTNILGVIFGAQVAAQGMLSQGQGAVYAMEGLGSNNMIQQGTILYGTTKHALSYFMKGLARELEGKGVIAGRLSPGMMLTDFITRDPDGGASDVLGDPRFRRVFNILADRPERVAEFLVPRMLRNRRNNAHIVWLTGGRAARRFMTGGRGREKLI